MPVAELLARMDRLNLKRIVILTGRWGDALQAVMDENLKVNPSAPIKDAAQIVANRSAEAVAASLRVHKMFAQVRRDDEQPEHHGERRR